MKVKYSKQGLSKGYDGVVLPFYEGESSTYDTVESLYGIEIPYSQLKERKVFVGKSGEVYVLPIVAHGKIVELALVGLGKKESVTGETVRKSIAKGYKALKAKKTLNIAILIDILSDALSCSFGFAKSVSEAVILADYKFDTYKEVKGKHTVEDVTLFYQDAGDDFERGFEEGVILGNSTCIARKLVDEPANKMYPETLAKFALALGVEKGFEVEVLNKEEIVALDMQAFLAVAEGSTKSPKFIIMRYKGDPEGETLGFVGKGLTYDSGGLSIKPTKSMADMKSDMGGSAAVIGAMAAIADKKLKVNVTTVVAACENMIDGNCYKPGDIIGSMGGKTVQIGNTDAEGRLTLIDAMHYIVTKEKVDRVVDIATLTGAAIYCTGSVATPAISNDAEFFGQMQSAFDKSGEKVWEMPIFDEYKELIKHEIADLTNMAGNPGTVTAGLFIGEFTGDLPWIHLDIAGTAYAEKELEYISKGGTGVGTKPLYYLAKSFAK